MSDKHPVTEEPCESKGSSTVLESSGFCEEVTDFNQKMTPVQAKKPGGLRISALSQEKIQRLQSLFIILRLIPMINTFSSLFLVIIAAIIGLVIIGNKRLFHTFVAVLGITALIFSSSLPVMAAPNSTPSDLGNITQVQDQYFCRFEESFSSSGDELEGLCVAQGQNENQSDADIIKAIKSKASDKNENNLIVRVDNGAVLLSGSMKDEEKARTFIKEVEQIPGIYLITVELGFTNTSNSDLG